MKITFIGYYGMDNFGDDLFTKALVSGNNNFWKKKIRFLSPRVVGVDAGFIKMSESSRKNYKLNNFTSKITRLFYNTIYSFKSDYFIYAGGSTIGSLSSNSMLKFHLLLSKLGIVKFGGIGISVGPFFRDKDYELAKKMLNRFTFLTVRDEESYKICKKMKLSTEVILSNDLVGLLYEEPTNENESNEDKIKTLGVSICNFERFNNEYDIVDEQLRNKALFSAIKVMNADYNVRIKIFCLNTNETNGDMNISRELFSYIDSKAVEFYVYDNNLNEIEEEICKCDAVISVRLHGAIPSYINEIPFSLIEYHDKCTEFLNGIKQPQSLRLSRKISDSNEVVEVLIKLLYEDDIAELPVKDYSKLSSLNFTSAPWYK